MTEMSEKVTAPEWQGLRPKEDLLHRIVDNLIEVHSMPSDFVSVIQPTAAKNTEGTGAEIAGKRPAPVLPVRDTVLFPHAVLPLTVGRESSIQLIQSLGEEKTILVVAQRDARLDSPRRRIYMRLARVRPCIRSSRCRTKASLCLPRGTSGCIWESLRRLRRL